MDGMDFGFLEREIFGVSVIRYGWMALAIFVGFVASALVKTVIRRIIKLTEKSESNLDDLIIDAIGKPLSLFCAFGGVYVATTFLPTEGGAAPFRNFSMVGGRVASVALLIWLAFRLIDALTVYFQQQAESTDSKFDDQLVPIARTSAKVFVGVVGFLWILQSMGYSISGLLAGVGIGGMAFALAAKDTLSNFFGSVLVFLDKPFQVGDWVKMGGVEGTVEEVGLRTTRIRTFANSQITLPNATVTTDAIENWSRMKKRRIRMTVGVTYGSTSDQVQKCVTAIREIIKNDDRFMQDFYLVNFTEFGASSLDIFIYAFSKTTVWAEYLELREEFNFKIMKAFEEIGVEFAFPSQTLYFDHSAPLPITQAAGSSNSIPVAEA